MKNIKNLISHYHILMFDPSQRSMVTWLVLTTQDRSAVISSDEVMFGLFYENIWMDRIKYTKWPSPWLTWTEVPSKAQDCQAPIGLILLDVKWATCLTAKQSAVRLNDVSTPNRVPESSFFFFSRSNFIQRSKYLLKFQGFQLKLFGPIYCLSDLITVWIES